MSCFIVSDADTVTLARVYTVMQADAIDADTGEPAPTCPARTAMALRELNNAAFRACYSGRHAEEMTPLESIGAHMADPMPTDAAIRVLVGQFSYQCDESHGLPADYPGPMILRALLARFPARQEPAAPAVAPSLPRPARASPARPQPRPRPPADEVF